MGSTPPSRTTIAASAPQITWDAGVVRIVDVSTFGKGNDAAAARFLDRVFQIDSVAAVELNRERGAIEIKLASSKTSPSDFLGALALAARQNGATKPSVSLPRWAVERNCTLHRNYGLVSTCKIITDRPGVLRIKHEAIRDDRVVSDDFASAIASIPGVLSARIGMWSNVLTVRFDSKRLAVARLVRQIETVLDAAPGWEDTLPQPVKTRYAIPNLTLATAAVGDFLLPVVAPASAAMLIWLNIRTFRTAGAQLKQRKIGVPLLYCTILGTALLSGQFFASALMYWTFKFWHGRLSRDVASQRRRLVAESLPRPQLARMLIANNSEVLVPLDRLRPGDRFVVSANETVPADGVIVEGTAIVDERGLQGGESVSRKRKGDSLHACSTVLVGELTVEVRRSIDETRSSQIVKSLVMATSPSPGPLGPTRRAEEFADRKVGATLATAGFGLLVGDLTTAAAILRPDYATGPGVTTPLETLRSVTLCARQGIAARDPEVFDRLAKVNEIVLIDTPDLHRGMLTVVTVHSPYISENEMLRYAASAFRHLIDDRATALIDACRERQIPVLNLAAVDFESGVTAIQDKHKIRVRERERALGAVGPLEVEVDGRPLGWISFARSTRSAAAGFVSELRRVANCPVILLTDRPASETDDLIRKLGVTEIHRGAAPDRASEFLAVRRKAGRRCALIGDCTRYSDAVNQSHVSISNAPEASWESNTASVLLLDGRLDNAAKLFEIARTHAARITVAERFIIWPGLFCVAGAFFFGATALTAVLVSNLGTLGLYNRSVEGLQSLKPRTRALAPPSRIVA